MRGLGSIVSVGFSDGELLERPRSGRADGRRAEQSVCAASRNLGKQKAEGTLPPPTLTSCPHGLGVRGSGGTQEEKEESGHLLASTQWGAAPSATRRCHQPPVSRQRILGTAQASCWKAEGGDRPWIPSPGPLGLGGRSSTWPAGCPTGSRLWARGQPGPQQMSVWAQEARVFGVSGNK